MKSHGEAIGCVVDGCPPLIPITADEIQVFLDKRKPGQSRFTTQRREADAVEILSGVFTDDEGRLVTTGAPISLLIRNTDQRSKDYGEIKEKFRPGHADFTYWKKYGIRDYRGGGRSSARETATRVAAGAIARKILSGITIRGALVQIGELTVDRSLWDWDAVELQSVLLPPIRAQYPSGRTISMPSARLARRSAPSWRSWPKACPPASARRSTASSIRISPAP